MKLRIPYFLMILLIVVSCTQYEKDDTSDLPPGYLKVPMGKTIKTELWKTILDARQPGVTVYKWKTNSMISPASNPDSPRIVPSDTGKYTVIYNNGQDSSKVIVCPRPICYIPNSFTTDRNHVWRIFFDGMSAIDVMVFSRDNVKLFETTDFQSKGWDGTYDEKLCPVGYYYYVVKYTSVVGKEYTITGYLHLLR
jgi:gliding motility-associated-like protein